MTERYREFPAALAAAREAAGLTQEELARRVGRTQQAVAKWESGESMPTRRSVTTLVQVLPELARLGMPMLDSTVQARDERVHQGGYSRFEPQTVRSTHDVRLSRGAEIEREIFRQLPDELKEYEARTRLNRFDYESPNAVVEILACPSTFVPYIVVAGRLWKLSAERLKRDDYRVYCLLLVADESDADVRSSVELTPLLRRLQEEAELHGIMLIYANGPSGGVQAILDLENSMRGAVRNEEEDAPNAD